MDKHPPGLVLERSYVLFSEQPPLKVVCSIKEDEDAAQLYAHEYQQFVCLFRQLRV